MLLFFGSRFGVSFTSGFYIYRGHEGWMGGPDRTITHTTSLLNLLSFGIPCTSSDIITMPTPFISKSRLHSSIDPDLEHEMG